MMRVYFLETPIDVLTLRETLETASNAMRSATRVRHVALNVAKLVKMRSDAALRADVLASDIIGIDGAGIVIGARLQGIAVPERVAGIDLMEALLQVCASEGFRPYFLGAKEAVLQRAVTVAGARFPGLRIAGARNGYFTSEQEPEIIAQINASGADCLFIGIPTPKKEHFLAAHGASLRPPFLMGVGGSFDVLAGDISRAPPAMQRLGLEWLHRTLREPRRMMWRYLSTNGIYSLLLTRALLDTYIKRVTNKRHPIM